MRGTPAGANRIYPWFCWCLRFGVEGDLCGEDILDGDRPSIEYTLTVAVSVRRLLFRRKKSGDYTAEFSQYNSGSNRCGFSKCFVDGMLVGVLVEDVGEALQRVAGVCALSQFQAPRSLLAEEL
jgi:hypothetical protein